MDEAQQAAEKISALLHQHLVLLVFFFNKDSSTVPFVVTTFVLSVQEQWFLVTAGHCLQQVEEYKEEGWVIQKCFLMDSLGLGAKYFEPIIFTYDLENPQFIRDEREMDYGIIPLKLIYKDLLKANGIKPLNEGVWKKQPKEPEFYTLIGAPSEFNEYDNETIKIVSILNFIDKCKRPDNCPETDFPLLWKNPFVSRSRFDCRDERGSYLRVQRSGRKMALLAQSSPEPLARAVSGCNRMPDNISGKCY
jgi:hypothetical protein